MSLIAQKVNEAVRAVCPIDGVSIGVETDKGTWRIDYQPQATTQERAAGAAALAAFDIAAAQSQDATDAARAALDAADLVALKADGPTMAFVNFTFAQLDTWVTNNIDGAGVSSLALLKAGCGTAFRTLGRIAIVAVRRWVRNGG